ncbi:hypothetical protein FEM08_20560 [Flavobacterium gilvum]|nr:hypothetical protein FEM08_20560 [Flavobacterium gilvum]
MFIDWLLETAKTKNIDAIIVAGDIFDVSNPSIEALNKYHYFLTEAFKSEIQVIITGGNHDSAARLNSYKDIFEILNISVVGGEHGNLGAVIPVFKRKEETPRAVVTVVPYLRDGDIRKISEGESLNEAHGLFTVEVKKHYDNLLQQAKEKHADIPVIGTAHLFVTGSVTSEPSEKKMHVLAGTLGQIPSTVFSEGYDYVAMGHIHKPQLIAHPENVVLRYSGSPIPLSFSERNDQKEVTLLTIEGKNIAFAPIPVPLKRDIIRFEGTANEIIDKIKSYHSSNELTTWGEIIITEKVNFIEFNEQINELCFEKNIEILNRSTRITNSEIASVREHFIVGTDNNPLDDVHEIFKLRCEKKGINEEGINELMPLFNQILEKVKATE